MTIFFPLIASVVFALTSKLNPTEKWAHVESAAAALEREIFLYRSRVGKYGKVVAEPQAGDNQEGPKPPNRRVVFAETVNNIMEDALSSDLRNDFLENPTISDKAIHVKLYDPEAEKKKLGLCCFALRRCLSRWCCCLSSCCHRSKKDDEATGEKLDEPLLAGSLALRKKTLPDITSGLEPKEEDLWKGSGADYDFNEDAVEKELQTFADDGICELQAEQYAHARLSPMLRHYNKRSKSLGRLVKKSQVLMTLMTGATTLFAAIKEVDLRPAVPILVALSALIAQCSEYERLPTRLVNVRKSVENLTKLQVWWAGLTPTEQRNPANKAKLVTMTEEQADAEISAWKKSSQVTDGEGPEQQDDSSQKKKQAQS